MTTGLPLHSPDTQQRLFRAPLIRVLCQARWQQLTKFDTKTVADGLAELVGDDYPFRDQQQEVQFTIDQAGMKQQPGGIIYRFHSTDKLWTIALSDTFISLETLFYEGHEDFIDRFSGIMASLSSVAIIPLLSRLGYRYTNRLDTEDSLSKLNDYFLPSVLGGLVQVQDSARVVQTITETLLQDEDNFLAVRSAKLSPGAIIDPTLPATQGESWIIDLDSYKEPISGITIDSVGRETEALSDQASKYFFSLITDKFMEDFQ